MSAFNKRVQRQRNDNNLVAVGEMFLVAALLTADDLFGLNDELTDRFITGYSEILKGYSESRNPEAMKEELADRGISLILDGEEVVKSKSNKHQRGIGEWQTIEVEGKKKIVCSHCGKGTVAKRNYCPECGAYMKSREKSNDT
jgi:hypothetical protein